LPEDDGRGDGLVDGPDDGLGDGDGVAGPLRGGGGASKPGGNRDSCPTTGRDNASVIAAPANQ
jgi:hypothetical protein